MANIENLIAELEQRRLGALCRGDMAELRALLTDDLVHVHATGLVEGRDAYLATMGALIVESAERLSHQVRVISANVAVSTGGLRQKMRFKADDRQLDMSAYLTQVWRDAGEGWKLCSFQATAMGEPPK